MLNPRRNKQWHSNSDYISFTYSICAGSLFALGCQMISCLPYMHSVNLYRWKAETQTPHLTRYCVMLLTYALWPSGGPLDPQARERVWSSARVEHDHVTNCYCSQCDLPIYRDSPWAADYLAFCFCSSVSFISFIVLLYTSSLPCTCSL